MPIKKAAEQTAASVKTRPFINKKEQQGCFLPPVSPSQAHSKESVILSILKSGNSLNRFEGERLGDHCLPSTIATLRGKGHLIIDQWEWTPTRFGKEVHVKRYSYAGPGSANE